MLVWREQLTKKLRVRWMDWRAGVLGAIKRLGGPSSCAHVSWQYERNLATLTSGG